MDLIFKCRNVLHIPRGGTATLGRRNPFVSWDNVLISRKHIQLRIDLEGATIDLSVTGRNAIVVERQEEAGAAWDVLTVVDPGASAALPLSQLTAGGCCSRFFVLGAREESAVAIRAATAAAAAAAEAEAAASAMTDATADANDNGAVQPTQSPLVSQLLPTRTGAAGAAVAAAVAAKAAAAAGRAEEGKQEDEDVEEGAQVPPAKRLRTAGSPAAAAAAPAAAAAHSPAVQAAAATPAAAAAAVMSAPAAASAAAAGSTAVPYDMSSPIHLLRTRGLSARHSCGCLGARLRQLVCGPLRLAVVSNYMVDMGWLLSCCPDLARADKFFLVHGEPPGEEADMRAAAAAASAPHLQLHRPPLPIAYGTHHTKAFLLQYDSGLRLIVLTANAIYADCNDKTQGLWVQDFPPKQHQQQHPQQPHAGSQQQQHQQQQYPQQQHPQQQQQQQSSAFERDLAVYFRSLSLPASMSGPLQAAIAAHDFTHARGALVPSVPGYHRGAAVQQYGHMRLRRLLEGVELPPGFNGAGGGSGAAAGPVSQEQQPGAGGRGGAAGGGGGGGGGGDGRSSESEGLVIQCSSMGSFDQAWLIDEFGCSLAAHRRPQQQQQQGQMFGTSSSSSPTQLGGLPRPSGPPGSGAQLPLAVVWPTVQEVRNSMEGWFAGRSIPGPAKNVRKAFMRRYYARWGGEAVGRQRAMPHIKTYTRYRGQQLAWFLVASHNLSKAAWGELQKGGSQLMIRSYELGVLVTPALEAAYRSSPHWGFCCHGAPDAAGSTGGGGSSGGSSSSGRQQSAAGAPPPQVTFLTLAGAAAAAAAAATASPHPPPTTEPSPGAAAASGRALGSGSRSASTSAVDAHQQQPGEVVVIPVPYPLPPLPYRDGEDQAWVVDEPQGGLDALGQVWGAPASHYGFLEPPSD